MKTTAPAEPSPVKSPQVAPATKKRILKFVESLNHNEKEF